MSTGGLTRSLRGTAGVGLGTAVLGASGYGFLTLTAGAVSAADYAALASLYLLVALVGPALCMPLEQEATRVVTAWRARHQGIRDATGQLIGTSLALSAVTAVGLALLAPVLVGRVFDGEAALWWALLASVLGFGAASVLRGILAGQQRLGVYGLMLGVDGVVRLVPCVVLTLAGVTSPAPYGLALGLGPVAALLVVAAVVRRGEPGPRLVWRELLAGTSWLVVAWIVSLTLANVGPVLVTALLTDDPGLAGTFAFVFVLVRIPLFLLFALQPVLLPALAHATASRDQVATRRGLKQALLLVAGLGVLLLATAGPVGGWLAQVLFPGRTVPSLATITLLAAGTVLAMLVQVLQPALVAVSSHRIIGAAWLGGAVAFAGAFLLPVGAVGAATAAQLASGLVTAAVMGVALRRHLTADPAEGTRVVEVPGQAS